MDSSVTIRRLAQKLFSLMWLKHGLIANLPPPGPTSPHRINDMSEKIAKSVLVYSYAARPVLQYYMEKHTQRIAQSKIAFWTHVSFLCLRIRLCKDNLFDYFLNTCSMMTEVALFCNWKTLDDVHTYALTFFAAFFENELFDSFFEAGGWAGLMNYIEDTSLLKVYDMVKPFAEEMACPCDIVPIMITVAAESLSAERRERIASSRELKVEEIGRIESVRLLTAKIFNWDFMEQLHISSLKPGVFKRMANIRRKGRSMFSDSPMSLSSRNVLKSDGEVFRHVAGKPVCQVNSTPNLRAPELDSPLHDSKDFQRFISAKNKQTRSSQIGLSGMPDAMEEIHQSASVDDKPARSSQVSPSGTEEHSKIFHQTVSVDDKLASSSRVSPSSTQKHSKTFHESISVEKQAISSQLSSSCIQEHGKMFQRSVSVGDNSTSHFLENPNWLKSQEMRYERPTSKSGVSKDNSHASLKLTQSNDSTTRVSQTDVYSFPRESCNEASEVYLGHSEECFQNISHENEILNLNASKDKTGSNSSNDTVLRTDCLDSKTELCPYDAIKPKSTFTEGVQICKEVPFEKRVNLRVVDQSKTLIGLNIDSSPINTDSKCDAVLQTVENDSSAPISPLSTEFLSNAVSSRNETPNLSFIKQSETKQFSNRSPLRQSKTFAVRLKKIDSGAEACASETSITNYTGSDYYKTCNTLRSRYQSFDFSDEESVSIKHNRTAHYKKRLFGNFATRKYSLKPTSANDIEYLESLNKNKRFRVPGTNRKVLSSTETTESESESRSTKNPTRDSEKIAELVKDLKKSGISDPVVFKI